ncbi:EAL and HDOD domain-containing protein [Propionivibrio dicarboxylicus]|uniref:EAL and modified HD-GYP domain-containing signal transduction protein n=1 Tax=Propionivibrio dicarboxylicus TaxID=83767 RepID=A0A1G8BLH9_9RHOO|nr:EAL domain-containing protein [Propionivibrio dicarboxylicus]SDH33904.1 EAL and modified HD-GYP domain-containing signal transduction protein [Propionivibrio dicarboxylicus]
MSDAQSPQVFLGRQPILGREQQLLAYELLFRNGVIATGNSAEVLDATQATTTVIANAFAELSIGDSLGPYRAYINVDEDFLFSDLIEALPPQLVVLEILETIQPTPEVIERCKELHDKGFTIALDDVIDVTPAFLPLVDHADIIKVDLLGTPPERLAPLVAQLKQHGKKLLAEKVETAEQLAVCQQLGFDYFQGYFFAKPTIISGRKLNPSQVILLKLLALVMQDAETTEIENAFKLEPGLTVNMLRLTNSVGCGLATRVTSLRHAITILGRRQIQRWLQLLVYTNPQAGGVKTGSPLLQLAATRGRLMELLAEHLQTKDREFSDQAFMVGIMSLMPALLGMAIADILAQLPVAPRVSDALINKGGPLGLLLQLVEATEQLDPAIVQQALDRLPSIRPQQLETALAEAFAWANHLNEEST